MHDRDSIHPVHRVSGAMPVPTAGPGTWSQRVYPAI